jgi:DNA-binding response OmpR family regulator
MARRPGYEGVGLGLNIAQRLVSMLNGNITLESRLGEGSHFTVNVPMERLAPIENVQRFAHGPVISDSVFPVRVLLIDDDEIFLDLISESLQKAGIVVLKCLSAFQAIHVLGEHSVDLIVTDMQMPSMNGMDLLAYIQRKTGRLIPVIAVSGRDKLGKDDFPGIKITAILKKPFLPEELFELISSALQRKLTPETGRAFTMEKQKSQLYNIEQIKQFALDDPQSIQHILVSFAESSYENLALFEKLLLEKDRKSLSELAHKMLAMFRQIGAEHIVKSLQLLEKERDRVISDEEWAALALDTLNRTKDFIGIFCEEQGIFIA